MVVRNRALVLIAGTAILFQRPWRLAIGNMARLDTSAVDCGSEGDRRGQDRMAIAAARAAAGSRPGGGHAEATGGALFGECAMGMEDLSATQT